MGEPTGDGLGIEKSFMDDLAVENFNNMMKKEKVYGDAKRYIDHLKGNNKKIILATSSMETIIKPLADYLGVDAIIATKFAFADGKCLGRFEGKPAFREEKRKKVLEYIKENNIDLAASSFYSDISVLYLRRIADLFLLRVRPARVHQRLGGDDEQRGAGIRQRGHDG